MGALGLLIGIGTGGGITRVKLGLGGNTGMMEDVC